MRRVCVSNLKPGDALPLDLYSSHGLRLLPRSARLSDRLLDRLSRLGDEFLLAHDAEEIAREGLLEPVDFCTVRAGGASRTPLISLGGRIVTEAGEVIDHQHVDALNFGVFTLIESEPITHARARRRLAEELVASRVESWTEPDEFEPEFEPVTDIDWNARADDWPDPDELIAWRNDRVAALRSVYARVLAGLRVESFALDTIIEDLYGMLQRSPSLFPQLALLCPKRFDYLPDHAISVAAIGMAIAARAGWSNEHIRLAGFCGLTIDLGMMLLPQRIRTSAEFLSDVDRSRLTRHPSYSVWLLESISGTPEVARVAAYRHHERSDGTGYPHGLPGRRIEAMGRLVALADTAAALNEPRGFREPLLSHETIAEISALAREGKYDRQLTRHLVASTGVYPIGSFVLLSTERVAQVIGQSSENPDRPIVRLVSEGDGASIGAIVDLSSFEPWELSVLDGVAPPGVMLTTRRAG
ncbi:MAG: HD-GYP domain-containing protein [Phycisphaerales bacterium]